MSIIASVLVRKCGKHSPSILLAIKSLYCLASRIVCLECNLFSPCSHYVQSQLVITLLQPYRHLIVVQSFDITFQHWQAWNPSCGGVLEKVNSWVWFFFFFWEGFFESWSRKFRVIRIWSLLWQWNCGVGGHRSHLGRAGEAELSGWCWVTRPRGAKFAHLSLV